MAQWTNERTERAAAKLAEMLEKCPVEERGNLLLKAAEKLRLNAQSYTGALLRLAGQRYNRGA